MKKMKKLFAILLCSAMVFSVLICTPVISSAAEASITAAVQGTYNQSANAQDITVRISVNDLATPYCAFGIEGGMVLPDGFVFKSMSTSNSSQPMTENDYEADADKPEYTKVGYMESNAEDTIPGNSYYDVVITAPSNAKGDYQITFKQIEISNNYGVDKLVTAESVTAVFTIAEVISTPGYTVTMSSDAPSAGVAKGSSFNVNLDVDNSEANAFNAFYSILSYDSAKVSYTGGETAGDFTVDTSEAGKLKITRTGSDAAIGETPELTLPFQANEAGTADFKLTKANVDVIEHAETQDAPEAAFSEKPHTVTILETYTVTFTGGTGATGTAPTQEATVENGTFKLPENPFTYENHTFAGWNDETATYQAGDTYTMPAKAVTFTAQWEEPIVPPEGTVISDYTSAGTYTLIKVTGIPDGNAVTYDGQSMVKDGDAYYIAVKGATEYDSGKLSYTAGTPETLDRTNEFDVNLTNRVDINDAQLIYNIYHGADLTKDPTREMLLADATKNGRVEIDDCSVIVGEIE